MANEWTLWAAIVAIVKADTGPGGIVTLLGQAAPLKQWGDPGMSARPIIAGSLGERTPLSPTEGHYRVPVTFDVFADPGSGDLPMRTLDRLEVVLTAVNLAAQGVDAAPFVRRRRSLPQMTTQGGQREAVDIDFLMTR